MTDARRHLRALDRIEPPDVWDEATTRAPSTQDGEGSVALSPGRRILAGVVAFAVFGAAVVFAALAFSGGRSAVDRPPAASESQPGAETPGGGPGAWHALPEGPLSPRHGAQAFLVQGRVVVLGGRETPPCPPAADCVLPEDPPLKDGAAFVPETGTWSTIAPSPVPLSSMSGAVLRDTLYLWIPALDQRPSGRPVFLAYHADEDRWEELPAPPGAGRASSLQLVATDDAVVAHPTTQEIDVSPDLLFDPSTGEWTELPPDPLVPSFDRAMVWTDGELLLLGIEVVPNPGSEGPALYRAAALDVGNGTWRRLPDSGVTGYDPVWFWAAGKVVNPTLGTSDGGEVNGWGRPYPHGGMLDPATGEWSDLPPMPEPGSYRGPSVGGGGHVVSSGGAVLDLAAETWSPLPAPPDAADEGAAAVWAGDGLLVWGGHTWAGSEATLLNTGWWWQPA